MTKEQQFNQEERQLLNKMDAEAELKNKINFIPIVGMQPKSLEGNGYKGIIEYVGRDYFILRCFRTGEPIFIRPFKYHNFEDYTLDESNPNLHHIFKNVVDSFFPPKK